MLCVCVCVCVHVCVVTTASRRGGGMDTADREGFPDTVAASQNEHFKQPLIQEYKLNRATEKTKDKLFL